ncbi:hypothetical protein QUA80_05445 [Microcoleus sp. F4-D5]
MFKKDFLTLSRSHFATPPLPLPGSSSPIPSVIAVTSLQILNHTLRLRLSRLTHKNITPIEQ